jgi:histidinol-phosphate phosphatase family protein
MRVLHGRRWRSIAAAPRGRLAAHAATTASLLIGASGLALGRSRIAKAGGLGWLVGTAELACARIAPGPRSADEVLTMLWTSVAIPPAGVVYRLRGELRARRLAARRPKAVLLDRDGTLIHDVPYNGDPTRVLAIPGTGAALDRLRAAEVRLAVISNQSGVARGLVSAQAVEAVNRRVEELLGPLGPWIVCAHAPEDRCACRKPAPGLVLEAARRLGVNPQDCVVIGDIGSDVDAARNAGASAVLVPTKATRREEIERAPHVAPSLGAAVDLLLEGRR